MVSEGKQVSPGIDVQNPLLPELPEVAFKIRLVMKSFEMIACEGRQVSFESFDLMESFEERLSCTTQTEESLCEIVDDFGRFLPAYLQGEQIEIDPRALIWVQRH